MSRFAVLAAIAACGGSTGRTGLDGRIACGDKFCETGQLCATTEAGVDAAVPGQPIFYCVTVADGCFVEDCLNSACPVCIRDLCSPGTAYGVELDGRNLTCAGV
ncbi:MAG TPA: hypothetical protein VFV99_20420 [Kofleriaceae bacterium]|nr:hypothetical protein [Kofleriaceae bacterium]